MSCVEEEDSSMDEEEDMPGLESVSSSEYVSDEDSVGFSSEEEDSSPPRPVSPSSLYYATARKWLGQIRSDIVNQLQVITVHLLSPFLYGCSHQTDKWLGWCSKVGLLQSDVNYHTGVLKDVELCAVYVLERAMEWCKESATKEGAPPSNLAELLQLAELIKDINRLSRALVLARKRQLFLTMLDSVMVADPRTNSEMEENLEFVETACLYVIAQFAEHVDNVINENINVVKEHNDYCHTEEMKFDNMITKGDELRNQGRYRECVSQYTTIINLCPYNFKVYMNRAHCYISVKEHRAAMADGLRAVYLKPDWSKGHLKYIQGLDGCGMAKQASQARKKYAQLFPGDSDEVLDKKERKEPTEEDRRMYSEIMKKCKQASEAFQVGNLTGTTFWYEEVWAKVKKSQGWRRCLEPVECDRFIAALHYIYGSALMGRHETMSVETSIPHFETIMTDFTAVKFPGAYYAAGRAYAFLRQHSDAVAMAKLGLEMVAVSSSCPPLLYPGTEIIIEDSKRDVIESKLKRLLQQCKLSTIPDAVCRYVNCLSHNSSSPIWSHHEDYRGHVSLECHEDCSIAYHLSCWRKYKTECEQKTDKEFLLTPCATPDCCGYVSLVVIYDTKGAIKAKFEASQESLAALKKSSDKSSKPTIAPSASSSSLTSKRNKRRKTTDKENDKPSPMAEEGRPLGKDERRKSDSESVAKVKTDKVENVKSEKVKGEKGEGVKSDKVKGEKGEGVKSDKVKTEKVENLKNEKVKWETGDNGRSDKVKGENGRSDKVKGEEEKGEEERREDVRRAEDSLEVIDRQRETETQEAAKQQKVKKKKAKKVTTAAAMSGGVVVGGGGGGGEKHWNDLFTLPEREGMVGEAAAVDSTWRPDPQAPFQTPSHLRDAVEEFERSQVPGLGLRPSSIPPPAPPDSIPYKNQQSSEDLEFIYSFFAEIFKTHGPLKPSDPTLSESLSLLPEEKKMFIGEAGGIQTFLLRSPLFCFHEGLICLSEDSPVVADSITLQASSSSSTSISEPPPLLPTAPDEETTHEPDRSGSSSTTSGSSPRDTPTESPQVPKKTTADKPNRPTRDKKSTKTTNKNYSSGNETANAGPPSPSDNTRVPTGSAPQNSIAVGSSRVDKTEPTNGTISEPKSGDENNEVIYQGSSLVHRAIQTERVLMSEQWVMTDPIPLSENFKERYEMVLREKIDLRAKLEEIEDRRFKMQRDHKREMEKMSKALRAEAKEEAQTKVREMELRLTEEKNRGAQEKKEQTDQAKALKAEIKSLTEKVERMKKDVAKKDQKLDGIHLQHQTELERFSAEHRKLEDRLRLGQDHIHLATQRAISAEIDILQLRVENVKRPGEARLMEIDRICNHIPPASELHREWFAYQEKLRTALECFQMATEEQIQVVKAGRELSTMEKIPNPSVPLPAHLAFRGVPMMRPPFPGPMRMPMRGPPLSMGVRPMMEGQSPPMGFPGGHPGVIPPHPGVIPPHPGVIPPHPMSLQQHQPRMEVPVPMAAALPQQQGLGGPDPSLATSAASLLPPQALPSQPSLPPQPLPSHHPLVIATGGDTEQPPRGSSKSSFDRIVEKLIPFYPIYSREDFKLILREVRRNNNNTLSGLSLDSIADQVRSIIETRERNKTGGGGEPGSKIKPRPLLPPVAQAPPPVNTSAEFMDEWSCVICYEDMDSTDSSRLMCGHRFHTECIKSWFKEQNTCPTCRNYALLPDEYPFLSH